MNPSWKEGRPGPLFFALLLIAAGSAFFWNLQFRQDFSRDLNVYWCTHQLLEQSRYPFETRAVEEVYAQALGEKTTIERPALAIPLIYLYLKFIFALPIQTAQLLWLILQLIFISLMVRWTWAVQGTEHPHLFGKLVALAFFPLYYPALYLGQVSNLAILGFFAFFRLLHSRKDGWAGAVLALTVIKPFLFLPVYAALAAFGIREKKWRMIGAFGVTLLAAGALTWVLYPNLFKDWLQMAKSTDNDLIYPSLPSLVRAWFFGRTGVPPLWPNFVFPAAASLYFAVRILRKKEMGWPFELPSLICGSIVFSPHVWPYDFSLLIFPIVSTWEGIRHLADRRKVILTGLFFGFGALLWADAFKAHYTHESFWIPVGVWLLWILQAKLKGCQG